ncbi:MAG: hypothetical protein AAFX09_12155 [Pseudomonadota bacterium]
MRIRTLAIDHASADVLLLLARALDARGHDCEGWVYNHNPAVREQMRDELVEAGLAARVMTVMSQPPLPEVNEVLADRTYRLRDRAALFLVSAGLAAIVRVAVRPRYARFRPIARAGRRIRAFLLMQIRDRRYAERLLDEDRPDAIIMGHDYVGHFSNVVCREARRRRIPLVLSPGLIPNREQLASRLASREHHQVSNPRQKLIARLWPKWVVKVDGQRILRLEWWRILVLELIGLSSPAPWVHQSGRFDAVFLADESEKKRYAALGFTPEKLIVTGSLTGDALALPVPGAGEGKPLLAVAVPPQQARVEGRSDAGEHHVERLNELRTLLEAVSEYFSIRLARHPREAAEISAPLAEAGFQFTEGSTLHLVRQADLFLSYVGSSTLRWGLWRGIPTFAWDAYGYEAAARASGDIADDAAPGYDVHLLARTLPRAMRQAMTPAGLQAWRERMRPYVRPREQSAAARIEHHVVQLRIDRGRYFARLSPGAE